MMWVAIALVNIASILGTVWLVQQGHPWFALLVLACGLASARETRFY
jgi:hypothetical protein